jgi:galactokinase
MPPFRAAGLHDLERAATLAVDHEDGPGAPMQTAFAPGRCTVVGEHVDYADGVVVCMAVHLGVAVAVRESGDGRWHVRSGERRAEREEPWPRGDVGDLPLATVLALRGLGVTAPPLEIRVVASLPEGAGLSSSAALCGATVVAVLRLLGVRLPAADLCTAMLHAERDIVGVPCGPLDQRAVVLPPADGALVLDCRDQVAAPLPWLAGHVLAACHTGATHDVGGEGYRSRRAQADEALRALGTASYRDLDLASVEAVPGLDPLLRRRARHIVSETARALDCAAALRRGDAAAVGRLMHVGHASLRDDYEVSTPALDAVAAAAEATPGSLGARLCGAGFGGTAVALVEASAADRCLEAMRAALPADAAGRGAWLLRPSPGLAALAPDVVA